MRLPEWLAVATRHAVSSSRDDVCGQARHTRVNVARRSGNVRAVDQQLPPQTKMQANAQHYKQADRLRRGNLMGAARLARMFVPYRRRRRDKLRDAAQAHRDLEARQTTGSCILVP